MKKRQIKSSRWDSKWQEAYDNRNLRLFLAFEWLRDKAKLGNGSAAILVKEIIRLKHLE